MNAKFLAVIVAVAAVAQLTTALGDLAPPSCSVLSDLTLSLNLPLLPVYVKLACELHCAGRGGVLDLCLGVLGNCACLEALSDDNGKISCDALQQTIVSIGIPIAPISLASACELHCARNGGVLSGCAAVAGGNCICVGVGDLLGGIKAPQLPSLPGSRGSVCVNGRLRKAC